MPHSTLANGIVCSPGRLLGKSLAHLTWQKGTELIGTALITDIQKIRFLLVTVITSRVDDRKDGNQSSETLLGLVRL